MQISISNSKKFEDNVNGLRIFFVFLEGNDKFGFISFQKWFTCVLLWNLNIQNTPVRKVVNNQIMI